MKIFLLLTSLIVGLAGCAAKAPSLQASKTSGGLTLSMLLSPDPPAPMKETQVRFKISDSTGHPVETADISVGLAMPGMTMPDNRPAVAATGGGNYETKAIFTMAGKWEIEVKVTHAEAVETFAFDLVVK